MYAVSVWRGVRGYLKQLAVVIAKNRNHDENGGGGVARATHHNIYIYRALIVGANSSSKSVDTGLSTAQVGGRIDLFQYIIVRGKTIGIYFQA